MEMMKNAYGTYMKFTDEEVMACRTDKKMLEMLAENSVAFVKAAVKGIYLTSDYTYEDKIQIGYEGFLKAVKKFDKERGASFYTFAYQAIRTELLNTHAGSKRAKRGWDEENNTYAHNLSLDAPSSDEDATALVDTLEDETVNVYSEAVSILEGLGRLEKILNPNQFGIFVDYYVHDMSLQEIATKRGLRKESVQRTAKEVVKIIRKRFTEAEFADMIGLR